MGRIPGVSVALPTAPVTNQQTGKTPDRADRPRHPMAPRDQDRGNWRPESSSTGSTASLLAARNQQTGKTPGGKTPNAKTPNARRQNNAKAPDTVELKVPESESEKMERLKFEENMLGVVKDCRDAAKRWQIIEHLTLPTLNV